MMQFMPITAARYGLTNPHDAGAAIDAAARYVRDLAARFDNRVELVLAAYNSGEETVEAYLTGRTIKAGNKVINPKGIVTGGVPPYRETRAYVAQGLRLLEQLPASPFLFTQPSASVEKNERTVDEEPVLQHGVVRKSVRPNLRPEQIETDSSKPISKRSIFFGKTGEQN